MVIPATYKTADDNGFYNIEFGVPEEMLRNADKTAKEKITFRLTASGNTLAPGLYYLRLLNKYAANAYKFVATDWKTGDAGRVAQDKISYDTEANKITVNCGTGNNNVCLTLDWTNTDYTVKATQKYLVVRGTNLATGTGKSYLWWLNGKNRGSQVAPDVARTVGDELLVAWDITKSNLDDNCKGDPWNASQGSTIFGLTSTTGTSALSHIGFANSVEELTDIASVNGAGKTSASNVYTLEGKSAGSANANGNLKHGVYIMDNTKVVR